MSKIYVDGAMEKLREWQTAQETADQAQARADALKTEFVDTCKVMGTEELYSRYTGDDKPLFTWRSSGRFSERAFAADRPDLAEQYTRKVVVERLDTEALAEEQPALYRAYVSNSARPNWRNIGRAVKAWAAAQGAGK